ncbi:hypothetical protein pb186bvf_008973 [Paramecium bursaria]
MIYLNSQNKRQFILRSYFFINCTNSIRTALKISLRVFSIDGIINLNVKVFLEQIDELRETYVGMGHEDQWQSALQNKLPLWSLAYVGGKNQLVVYRSPFSKSNVSFSDLIEKLSKGSKENQQMELLFITNDEEERHKLRYSIQTHEFIPQRRWSIILMLILLEKVC